MEETDELTSKISHAVYAVRFKGFTLSESELILTNISLQEKISPEELAITVKDYIKKVQKFNPVYCLVKEYTGSDLDSGVEKHARMGTRKPHAFIFKRKGDSVVSEYHNHFINSRKIGMSLNNYKVSIVDI